MVSLTTTPGTGGSLERLTLLKTTGTNLTKLTHNSTKTQTAPPKPQFSARLTKTQSLKKWSRKSSALTTLTDNTDNIIGLSSVFLNASFGYDMSLTDHRS